MAEADQVMAATADASASEQQPAGGADAVANTAPGTAVDDGSAQPSAAAEGGDVQAEPAPSAAPAAGQAIVDKFTLDMF